MLLNRIFKNLLLVFFFSHIFLFLLFLSTCDALMVFSGSLLTYRLVFKQTSGKLCLQFFISSRLQALEVFARRYLISIVTHFWGFFCYCCRLFYAAIFPKKKKREITTRKWRTENSCLYTSCNVTLSQWLCFWKS